MCAKRVLVRALMAGRLIGRLHAAGGGGDCGIHVAGRAGGFERSRHRVQALILGCDPRVTYGAPLRPMQAAALPKRALHSAQHLALLCMFCATLFGLEPYRHPMRTATGRAGVPATAEATPAESYASANSDADSASPPTATAAAAVPSPQQMPADGSALAPVHTHTPPAAGEISGSSVRYCISTSLKLVRVGMQRCNPRI